MVLATQNPREYHGTFPLPESQLDRFLMRISIGYPDADSERAILLSRTSPGELEPVLSAADVSRAQAAVEEVRVDPALVGYVLDIVAATRRAPAVELGASPRAARRSIGQAAALVEGCDYVRPDHIKELAVPVLAHRLQLRGEGITDVEREESVLAAILEVRVPL